MENQGGFQYSYLIADGAESYDPASFQNRNVSVWTGPDACEVWRISAAADGYMLSPVVATDGRVLNAYANEPVSGTNVNIQDNHYPAREDTCQWWKFERVSGGYLIHNVHNPHVVLAVSGDGHNVIVESRTGAANQIWVLRSYSSDPTPTATPEPTPEPTATLNPSTSAIIASDPTPAPTQTPEPTEAPARVPGDVDENGSVNLTDALLVLKYELNNEPNPTINLVNANVNGDECVDMLDVSLIAQYAAGWDVTLK